MLLRCPWYIRRGELAHVPQTDLIVYLFHFSFAVRVILYCPLPILTFKSSHSTHANLRIILSPCHQVHLSYDHSSSVNLLLESPGLDYFSNFQFTYLSPSLSLSYLLDTCSQNDLSNRQ